MPRLTRSGLVAAVLMTGCAQIGEPPGGPLDRVPPQLLSTIPDSVIVDSAFEGDVEFRFNEIVNEGSSPNFGLGTGDLEKLVVLSPSENVPNVGWKKSRITVRPKEGWQPNRVYRVELLPGIADLRSNRSQNGRVITFTTGAPIPTRFVEGRVVDWGTARPQTLALVEALLLPDSLRYRTAADSSGRFQFGPLPAGELIVSGVIDQNRNNRFDPREAFDSVRLAPGRDSAGELWAFRHDTLPPRIQSLSKNDSLSITVAFTQQLDPYQRFELDSVLVRRLPDSIRIEVERVVTVPQYDSLFRRAPATADTGAAADSARARARADSVRRARADSVARADSIRRARLGLRQPAARRDEILTTKPALSDRLVIRLATALRPGTRYLVDFHGVRSVSAVAGRALLAFQVPEERPTTPPDSTRADTTRARPDSTRRPPRR